MKQTTLFSDLTLCIISRKEASALSKAWKFLQKKTDSIFWRKNLDSFCRKKNRFHISQSFISALHTTGLKFWIDNTELQDEKIFWWKDFFWKDFLMKRFFGEKIFSWKDGRCSELLKTSSHEHNLLCFWNPCAVREKEHVGRNMWNQKFYDFWPKSFVGWTKISILQNIQSIFWQCKHVLHCWGPLDYDNAQHTQV